MDKNAINPRFHMERLYVKDMTCKVPRAPHIFTVPAGNQSPIKPTTQFELQIKHQALTATFYEVVLQITATSLLNESTAFTLDLQQGGLFSIEGHSAKDVAYLLNAYRPHLLYPYVVRAVTDASLQAGFPPLLLAPMNFDHLYQQQLAAQGAADKENTSRAPPAVASLVEANASTVQ